MNREELCVKALEGMSDADLQNALLFKDQYERLAKLRQHIERWMLNEYQKVLAKKGNDCLCADGYCAWRDNRCDISRCTRRNTPKVEAREAFYASQNREPG